MKIFIHHDTGAIYQLVKDDTGDTLYGHPQYTCDQLLNLDVDDPAVEWTAFDGFSGEEFAYEGQKLDELAFEKAIRARFV